MSANTIHELIKVHWNKSWNNLRNSINSLGSTKDNWQTLIPLFEQISSQNAVFIMIWNLMTNRIVYTVDKRSVCGYDASMYLADTGMNFSVANIHPESLYSVVKMNEQGIKFLTAENKERDKTTVNLEGLYKKNTGQYFHFLQQSLCMQFDSEGNPFLFLSYIHDVTYIKKNRTANLVLTTPNRIKWWNFNFENNAIEIVQPLSKQEQKILSLLAEGKSSKEIASELFVSRHTIDTHRRHLLEKTNCIDTTGMITYCKLVGLL